MIEAFHFNSFQWFSSSESANHSEEYKSFFPFLQLLNVGHTVVIDIYKDYWWRSSLGKDPEEKAMSEGLADYYACRSLGDNPAVTSPAYADHLYGDPIQAFNIDTSGPSNWSEYNPNADPHFNSQILTSTMWDVAKDYNPQLLNPTSDWDEIMWTVLNEEPRDHAAWRDGLEYWALQQGGASYHAFAWMICDQHGMPSRFHAPLYVDPH